MLKNNRSFEAREFKIDVDEPDFSFISWLDKYEQGRVKIIADRFEKTGDDEQAESLVEVLFGGIKGGRNSKFFDVRVVNPISGITKNGEYISVKSTKTAHTLEGAISETNGFKLGSLIQFMFERLEIKVFRNKLFKERNEIKLSVLLANYNAHISNFYREENIDIYNYAYVNGILVFNIIKEFLAYYFEKYGPIENRNLIDDVMVMSITSFIDNEFKMSKKRFDDLGTGNERDSIVVAEHRRKNFIKLKKEFYSFYKVFRVNYSGIDDSGYDNIDIDLIPRFKDIYVSYCVLFFDVTDARTGDEIINIYKTQSLPCSELYKNSAKAWLNMSLQHRQREGNRGKNVYLNFEGVLKAFEGNGLTGRDVFDTIIKIRIPASWNVSDTQEKMKNTMSNFMKHIWILNQPGNESERDKFIEMNPSCTNLFFNNN
jgi:hypothetical protein